MIDEWDPKVGVRLDILRNIVDAVDENVFLQGIYTEPSKHLGLISADGDFQFALVTPDGEDPIEISNNMKKHVIKHLNSIMLANTGSKGSIYRKKS